SNNLAILGVVRGFHGQRLHVITQAIEHKAVLEVCEAAKDFGAEVTILPVDAKGRVGLDDLRRAIQPNTVLISIMAANNEIGTVQPIAEIAGLCAEKKIVFHVDAAQGICKIGFDLAKTPIDMISISGHKIYGPKGVGALIVRKQNRSYDLKPLFFGGEQENKLRPGTLNVPGIVGLGQACAVPAEELLEESRRLHAWREQIRLEVVTRFPHVIFNGSVEHRLCNNLSFSIPGMHADDLALNLWGVAFSSGSACNSGNPKPSHVLKALGLADDLARATLRLGLGRFTTAEEVSTVTSKILKMLEKMTSPNKSESRTTLDNKSKSMI
ncbi:MAG: cysteine desulfurase family protein, partial [Bdellovibrionales bacterium]